jgi:hypothetical protein
MRLWLSCACVLLTACPQETPLHRHQHDDRRDAESEEPRDAAPVTAPDAVLELLDGGQGRLPDAQGRLPDAQGRLPDAQGAAPDGSAASTNLGLVQLLWANTPSGAGGGARFTHGTWVPDVGECIIPSATGTFKVGPSIDLTSSGYDFTLDWIYANQVYEGWVFDMVYLLQPGAEITASAPGDQAPGFTLKVTAPQPSSTLTRLVATDQPKLGVDLPIDWNPVGADRVTIALAQGQEPTPLVACGFPDSGHGVIPAAFVQRAVTVGGVSVMGWQVNEAVVDVGGWKMRFWAGTYLVTDVWFVP